MFRIRDDKCLRDMGYLLYLSCKDTNGNCQCILYIPHATTYISTMLCGLVEEVRGSRGREEGFCVCTCKSKQGYLQLGSMM